MLEYFNTDILILVAMAATAGGLSSVLFGKWLKRRADIKRVGWQEKELDRIETIKQLLKGGRDA